MADTEKLWMVVRTDMLGSAFLVKDGLENEGAARDYIDGILTRHRKPHGQDYGTHPYTPGTRAARIGELRLIL